MDRDHSYGVSSTQDKEVFSSEWLTMLSSQSLESQPLNDTMLNLQTPFNVDFDQNQILLQSTPDVIEYVLNNKGEIIETDGSQCEILLNSIIPKEEIIETSCGAQYGEASNPSKRPSSLPPSQNWPGEYGFNFSFEKRSKQVSWTYSQSTEKLYVGKGVPCPINFSTDYVVPEGVKIRAMALYSSPDSASEVVARCANHSRDDKAKNIMEADHLVRCESPNAVYEVDAVTERYSVVIPFENPPAGQSFSTYIYKFTCLGSCPGPNRRPLMLVFSLEKDNQVLGRRKLDVKICACPLRDSRLDEQRCMAPELSSVSKKRKKKQESVAVCSSETLALPGSSYSHLAKKGKVTPNQDGMYEVKVKDYKCYEFLEQMRKYYDIIKTMKSMPSDVKKFLERYQQRKGYNLNLEL